MHDCFITLRYDPPLWLVTAVIQTAIFFLFVLQFPGASFQCGNTSQDPSGVLTDIYHSISYSWNVLPSQYFSVDISCGCVIKPKLAAA